MAEGVEKMAKRVEVLETRMGRLDDTVKSFVEEFSQSLMAKMTKLLLAVVGACCHYRVRKDRLI